MTASCSSRGSDSPVLLSFVGCGLAVVSPHSYVQKASYVVCGVMVLSYVQKALYVVCVIPMYKKHCMLYMVMLLTDRMLHTFLQTRIHSYIQ